MKLTPIICLVVVSMQHSANLYAQSFINRGFETTTITPVVFPGGTRYVATVPGWAWTPPGNFVNGDPNSVGYNELALDSPAVNLQGTSSPFAPAISGSYSILLQGGSQFVPSSSYSAIWQTGQIPADTATLIYWGGALQVSFSGHSLIPVAIGSGASYTIWGMDISAYAGQTGELRFTAPWRTAGVLDSIQFSTTAIPEPSAFALLSFGLFCLFITTTRPNQGAAANRRPAGQSDGSGNLSATVAADRAFPAAVAELGR